MPPECDTPECSQALARLQAARNLILRLCSQITQLRASAASFDARSKTWGAIAVGLLAIAAALAHIPVVGPWIAIPFGLAALAALIAAINFAIKADNIDKQIIDLEAELVAAREAFDRAVADVMANCPSDCWGVLDQPTCP